MFAAARRLPSRLLGPTSRCFHQSAPVFVRVGDKLPDVELFEDSPGNKVNLAKEHISKGLVIGVPAAFSPSCSESHIPGYINHAKLKDAGPVFVVSVNDAFVLVDPEARTGGRWDNKMKAWAQQLDPSKSSGIRFLGDPSLVFTKALDLNFDGAAIFGGDRSKRYVLKIEDGAVKEAHVEPDNTGLNVSAADKVL